MKYHRGLWICAVNVEQNDKKPIRNTYLKHTRRERGREKLSEIRLEGTGSARATNNNKKTKQNILADHYREANGKRREKAHTKKNKSISVNKYKTKFIYEQR